MKETLVSIILFCFVAAGCKKVPEQTPIRAAPMSEVLDSIPRLYVSASDALISEAYHVMENGLFESHSGFFEFGKSLEPAKQFLMLRFSPGGISYSYNPGKNEPKPFVIVQYPTIDEIRIIVPSNRSGFLGVTRFTLSINNMSLSESIYSPDGNKEARGYCTSIDVSPKIEGNSVRIMIPEKLRNNIDGLIINIAQIKAKAVDNGLAAISIQFFKEGKQMPVTDKSIKRIYDDTEYAKIRDFIKYTLKPQIFQNKTNPLSFIVISETSIEKVDFADETLTTAKREAIAILVERNKIKFLHNGLAAPLAFETVFSSYDCRSQVDDDFELTLLNSAASGRYHTIPKHPHAAYDRIWSKIFK